MENINPAQLNTIVLAFLGDAVYEEFIRKRLILEGRCSDHADLMHKEAVKYVRASAQADIINAILPELTEDETALVLRARNHKIATKPKNADVKTYKWATAFEALIGYLSLKNESSLLSLFIIALYYITF